MSDRGLVPTTVSAGLRPFVDAGILGAAEVHSARFIAEVCLGRDDDVSDVEMLALAFAVWSIGRSHVCLDLSDARGQVVRAVAASADDAVDPIARLPWPQASDWRATLSGSRLVTVADDDDAVDGSKPLVLRNNRLYLLRQWIDEGIVADLLARRLREPAGPLGTREDSWARAAFAEPDKCAEQISAVQSALAHSMTVLLGGPGTGKTFTIAAMLHALAERRASEGGTPLRVALAAPTAKAAQQMRSSIVSSIDSGIIPAAHVGQIREWASSAGTIHGLLGVRGGNLVRFRHDTRNPLGVDVVVIDEVSMVSLPLMARLLEAVPSHATLILVGDPRQLQSIETGAVLAQLWELRSRLPQMVVLRHNRRQETVVDGELVLNAIGRLALEMAGDHVDESPILRILRGEDEAPDSSVQWIRIEPRESPTSTSVTDRIASDLAAFAVAKRLADVDADGDDAERESATAALRALESIRILCAHRSGPWGVSDWNAVGERVSGVGPNRAAPGRPLLVTRNDRSAGISNGDVGIVWGRSRPRAALHVNRGRDLDAGSLRLFDLSELGDVETSFAMTVHKAQGSQYRTVVFVVPPIGSPLLQHELIYTAVTRAQSRLVIVGSTEAITTAMRTRVQRTSGLAARIIRQL